LELRRSGVLVIKRTGAKPQPAPEP
jgi:hypothetical protein